MLQTNALVVSLFVSQWSARKLDRKVTDEVNSTHMASSDAGRYNKLLVSKEQTEAISKIVNRARTFHYENTLAWSDNNERLLPSANYFTYIGEMAKLKSEFDQEVAAFLQNYDNVIEQAKIRLNGMFKAQDYPSRSEIIDKFSFRTSFFPVPETDIRVQLSNDEVDKLKAQIGEEINNRLSDAVGDVWNRVKEQLAHMSSKLNDEKGIFRDSMFDNLSSLIRLLPKLNVTNDPHITEVCEQMKNLVIDPSLVRESLSERSYKAKQVDDIMERFGSFFNQNK